jgi:hypothetical protein
VCPVGRACDGFLTQERLLTHAIVLSWELMPGTKAVKNAPNCDVIQHQR